MTAITFDTLKFVHRLRESGIPETQAEAIAEAFKDASGGAELATKADITRLETAVLLLEQRMTIKLGGLIVVATGLMLAAICYLPGGHP